jgi:hypothetical protein
MTDDTLIIFEKKYFDDFLLRLADTTGWDGTIEDGKLYMQRFGNITKESWAPVMSEEDALDIMLKKEDKDEP